MLATGHCLHAMRAWRADGSVTEGWARSLEGAPPHALGVDLVESEPSSKGAAQPAQRPSSQRLRKGRGQQSRPRRAMSARAPSSAFRSSKHLSAAFFLSSFLGPARLPLEPCEGPPRRPVIAQPARAPAPRPSWPTALGPLAIAAPPKPPSKRCSPAPLSAPPPQLSHRTTPRHRPALELSKPPHPLVGIPSLQPQVSSPTRHSRLSSPPPSLSPSDSSLPSSPSDTVAERARRRPLRSTAR